MVASRAVVQLGGASRERAGCGAIDDDVVMLGDGAQLKRVSEWRVARGVQAPSLLAIRSRDQLQRSKARMPVFADDDVIMHRHSERAGVSMIALVIWISACDRTRADWNWPALYISVLG
jgi:hypothetical protein